MGETSAPGLRCYLVTFLPFDLVDAVHPTTQAGGCVGICSYIPKDLPNIHKDVRSRAEGSKWPQVSVNGLKCQ